MKQRAFTGFTLLELLLVMVVISGILVMTMGYLRQKTLQFQIQKAVVSAQEILSAGMSYYVTNNSWPADLGCLLGAEGGNTNCSISYLSSTLYNPFLGPYAGTLNAYYAGPSSSFGGNAGSTFAVLIPVSVGQQTYAISQIIAGQLPLATVTGFSGFGIGGTCTSTSTVCAVLTQVNIPAQNLNNGNAVNFANIYHSGACVPVPNCVPDSNNNPTTAEIMVVPAAVTGANASPTNANTPTCNDTETSGCTVQAYPITSFTASAVGPVDTSVTNPGECQSPSTPEPCYQNYTSMDTAGSTLPTGKYWRVCLSVVTENGQVIPSTNEQGELTGSVMAITRCALTTDNPGSGFSVWSN